MQKHPRLIKHHELTYLGYIKDMANGFWGINSSAFAFAKSRPPQPTFLLFVLSYFSFCKLGIFRTSVLLLILSPQIRSTEEGAFFVAFFLEIQSSYCILLPPPLVYIETNLREESFGIAFADSICVNLMV